MRIHVEWLSNNLRNSQRLLPTLPSIYIPTDLNSTHLALDQVVVEAWSPDMVLHHSNSPHVAWTCVQFRKYHQDKTRHESHMTGTVCKHLTSARHVQFLFFFQANVNVQSLIKLYLSLDVHGFCLWEHFLVFRSETCTCRNVLFNPKRSMNWLSISERDHFCWQTDMPKKLSSEELQDLIVHGFDPIILYCLSIKRPGMYCNPHALYP